MYVILLMAAVHATVWVTQIAMAKRVNLMALLWTIFAGYILVGGVGIVAGLLMAFNAVAQAAPEAKQSLLAAGISTAIISQGAAMLAVPIGGVANIIASTLVKTRQRPKDPPPG